METPQVSQKLAEFLIAFKSQTYKKKEMIVRPEEKPGVVYCLQEGIVRMYALSANGEELVINTFKPNAYFPMGWVLNDIIPRHYYEAMETVVVKKIPKNVFKKFLEKNPAILMDLTKRIYYGLEGYFTRMEYLMSGNAASRLITELLIMGKRFGNIEKKATILSIRLTEKDLAAQTGMTRETVSRELNRLKKKGLVSLDKSFLKIPDIAKLEEVLIA